MGIQVNAITLHGNHNVVLTIFPDECPICHTSLHPRLLTAIYHSAANRHHVHAAFLCTKPSCGSMFVGIYTYGSDAKYHLQRTTPKTAKSMSFPDDIKEISPTFVDVHNQSYAAESQNLNQLTGIGLRKALEFLVKDYSIHLNPTEAESIKAMPLAKCIDQYIDDPKVKKCATLATWLGNDETHYVRKWNEKDISDLKLLIRLTVNWIESSVLTDKYSSDMQNNKSG